MTTRRLRETKTNRRWNRTKWLYTTGAVALVASGVAIGWTGATFRGQKHTVPSTYVHKSRQEELETVLQKEKVDVIGGSMAHGWKDPNDDSYLRRAFQSLTSSTDTQYQYIDHTLIGGRAVGVQKSGQMQQWLKADEPQIVVISWGLLDDAYDKTPISALDAAVQSEIAQSLAEHAVVILVTPPVVKATARYDHAIVEKYIQGELSVANQFHNPNVYFFDVNAQMTTYMTAHDQTWQMYYGDSWHPNQAGHVLAGQLLYNDLVQKFGTGPIRFLSKQAQK